MPKPRYAKLLETSEAALVSAIEIYNKPDFKYREETFAILALNAWELLLKAKLLAENKNHAPCLYMYEHRPKADGSPSEKWYIRRNRAGNPYTIGLRRAIALLENRHSVRLDNALKANLDALIEIRDNAVHFVNVGLDLYKQVLEVGTATIRNYVTLAKRWFARDLSQYHFFLMPLGFLRANSAGTALLLNPQEKNVVNYLADLVARSEQSPNTDFHVSLTVNLSFQRSKADTASAVVVTNDPTATPVTLTEENVRERYPWDYRELTRRLNNRYIDFKVNQKYHDLRKPLMKDQRYVSRRYLDPGNPRSAKKDFYSPNVFSVFDRHYTRKGQ